MSSLPNAGVAGLHREVAQTNRWEENSTSSSVFNEETSMLGPPVGTGPSSSAPLPTCNQSRTLQFEGSDESRHREDFEDNGYMQIKKKSEASPQIFRASIGRLSYPAIAVIAVGFVMLACMAVAARTFGTWGSHGDHSNIVDKQLVGTVVRRGFLVNRVNGKCIDVRTILGFGPGKLNALPLKIGECEFHEESTTQMWEMTDGGYIRNAESGKCIDVRGEGFLSSMRNTVGTWHLPQHAMDFTEKISVPLVLSDCEYYNPTTDQTWALDNAGFITNKKTGKCLDVYGNPGWEKGLPLHVKDCEFGVTNTDQQWTFTLAEEGQSNRAFINSPVCQTEVPGSGFPGLTAIDSDKAWFSGRQPKTLACWPQTADGSILPCDEGSFKVLDDTATGWPGKCFGLGMLNSNLLAGEDSYGFNCSSSCEHDPECSVWQLGKENECFQGFGAGCYEDEFVTPSPEARQDWFHKMEAKLEDGVDKIVNEVADEVRRPLALKAAQRLQHGQVRVLMSTKGMEIIGLRPFKDYVGTDPVEASLQCKLACYSYVLCQYWQYTTAGCFLEDPKRGHPAQYPLTLEGAPRDTAFAKQVIDGEYIQHVCGQPPVISPVTSATTGMPLGTPVPVISPVTSATTGMPPGTPVPQVTGSSSGNSTNVSNSSGAATQLRGSTTNSTNVSYNASAVAQWMPWTTSVTPPPEDAAWSSVTYAPVD